MNSRTPANNTIFHMAYHGSSFQYPCKSKTRWIEQEFRTLFSQYQLPFLVTGVHTEDERTPLHYTGNFIRFSYSDLQLDWGIRIRDARSKPFDKIRDTWIETDTSNVYTHLQDRSPLLGAVRLMFMEVVSQHNQMLVTETNSYVQGCRPIKPQYRVFVDPETDSICVYNGLTVMTMERIFKEEAIIPSHCVFAYLDTIDGLEVKSSDVVTVAVEKLSVIVTHNGKAYNSKMWPEVFILAYEDMLDV